MFDDLTVDYKAVGFEGTLAFKDLPESTIKAALIYGARRLLQDSCNSEAKKLRDERGLSKDDELPEEDRRTIYEARLGALMDGNLRVTSTKTSVAGLSDEHARVLTQFRKTFVKDHLDAKAYKAADTKERQRMLVDWMVSETAQHDRWTMIGAKLLAADKAHEEAVNSVG